MSIIRQSQTIQNRIKNPTDSYENFPDSAVEQSIPAGFERKAEKFSNRVAIKSQTTSLTYTELIQESNRIAQLIYNQMEPGNDPVMVLLDHDHQIIVTILGVLKAGKFFIILDPNAPIKNLKDICSDSQASLLLTNSQNVSLAKELELFQLTFLNIDQIPADMARCDLELEISPNSIAALYYTSGSTGIPKGSIQTHRTLLHFAQDEINGYKMGRDDRQALLTGCHYSWSISIILGTILSGGTLNIYDISTAGLAGLTAWLSQERITILQIIPSLLQQLVGENIQSDEQLFPYVRILTVGGETTLHSHLEIWRRYFPPDCIFVHAFGSSEAGLLSWCFIDKAMTINTDIIPLGHLTPDKEIVLLAENRDEVPLGTVGEIVVKSRFLIPGYWRKPNITSQKFITDQKDQGERIYLSGDLGRLRTDGGLEYLGRKDFQVKIRGQVVHPDIPAATLQNLENIKQAIVIASGEPPDNFSLIAYLIAAPDSRPTISDLRRKIGKKLPDYMLPTKFVFLDQFPITPTGKIDRKALPAPEKIRPVLDSPYVQPGSAIPGS